MTGRLRPAAELTQQALAILAAERARLAPLLPDAELSLVGGASIAAALTVGDVDLHLRVPPARFAAAVTLLRDIYPVRRLDIWQPTLATFAVPADLPAGIAVTPIGSAHDVRFTRTWQLLASDPQLVAAYNAMKLRHVDGPAEAYEAAKSAFFTELTGSGSARPPAG